MLDARILTNLLSALATADFLTNRQIKEQSLEEFARNARRAIKQSFFRHSEMEKRPTILYV
ncbi:hypothetical protein KIN20_036787 [Parelaphostrongylus tenuis]|uniref:Uncharacterized protein n=1 Tax=Parelaphostrongylus tenuis TaxID=148309 RepID=A0AAD5RDL3_PARTN|nr:hypothetical protein KIN20_036787 [Parelaphostrongylus tenuis]